MRDEGQHNCANARPEDFLFKHRLFRRALFRAFDDVAIFFELPLHADRQDAEEAKPPTDNEDDDKSDRVHLMVPVFRRFHQLDQDAI